MEFLIGPDLSIRDFLLHDSQELKSLYYIYHNYYDISSLISHIIALEFSYSLVLHRYVTFWVNSFSKRLGFQCVGCVKAINQIPKKGLFCGAKNVI
jgi:hypothetical protein